MTELTKFFADLSFGEPYLWVALAAGLVVLLVFLFLGRRQRRALPVVGTTVNDELSPTADAWLPPPKRPDERRRSTRRAGVPTPVLVADPKKAKRTIEAFVLDRSSGGIRLASEKPFPTGSTLQVRPSHAHEDSPWVVIIIRSCREVGDYFELGCQFQEDLPWSQLLMFG